MDKPSILEIVVGDLVRQHRRTRKDRTGFATKTPEIVRASHYIHGEK